MIAFLITVIKLLIILACVAVIHEFGHFIFAKLFKMDVNEFSIGFGPKIVQKKYKGTMYSLRWIPLGGYCAIEGEDGESETEGSFAKKGTFAKLVVLIAGATFNAILAFVLFISVTYTVPTYNTKITGLSENSVAANAGLQVGDEIVSINEKDVHLQSELINRDEDGNDAVIEYIRNGKTETVTVKDATQNIGYIGVSFLATNDASNTIEMVASGGKAADNGLKAGDQILSINRTATNTADEVVNYIRENPDKQLDFEIKRDNETFNVSFTPDSKRNFDLGITSTKQIKTNFKYAMYTTFDNIKTIVGSYVDLFKGKVGLDQMSGIVGIGEVVSKTSGFIPFLNLMAIISLAVGVANIMPFPPLDGGKMVIVIGEAITRKKMPINVEAILSYIGLGLLILLTIFVTYNDIVRIF